MKITVQRLKELRACSGQVELFQQLFGDEAEVTVEKCLEVYDKFYWDWAADKLLPDPARAEYYKIRDAAYAEYRKIVDPAWAEYRKIVDAAWAECCKIVDPASAWVEYEKAVASAGAEYCKIVDAAWAEFNKARARAFGESASRE